MRLLNTNSLAMEEFWEPHIPEYAILSHRWETEEVTFQDMRSGSANSLAGYSKIRGFCAQAKKDGFLYGWVDTCCIDKTSSAELSESIVSMWKWYENSQHCYAYLSDVPAGCTSPEWSWRTTEGKDWDSNYLSYLFDDIPLFVDEQEPVSEKSPVLEKPFVLNEMPVLRDPVAQEVREEAFRASVWFTRGWTLQELLAPPCVEFFDSAWESIGSRDSLSKEISTITRIRSLDLAGGPRLLKSASVSMKFSWAADRETTRVEDQAYSLMGIFGVYFPPLYGEGSNAFKRLQIEIMKESSDNSIFASTYSKGLFADSPLNFRETGDLISGMSVLGSRKTPFSLTNIGLHIKLPLLPVGKSRDFFYGLLDCFRKDENGHLVVAALRLRMMDLHIAQRHSGLTMVKISQTPYDFVEKFARRQYIYIERETNSYHSWAFKDQVDF